MSEMETDYQCFRCCGVSSDIVHLCGRCYGVMEAGAVRCGKTHLTVEVWEAITQHLHRADNSEGASELEVAVGALVDRMLAAEEHVSTLRDALSWEVQARDRFAELAVRLEEREKLLAARGAEWATRAKSAEGLLREMASQRQCHSARCAMWVDEVYLCTCWLVEYMVPQEVAP